MPCCPEHKSYHNKNKNKRKMPMGIPHYLAKMKRAVRMKVVDVLKQKRKKK